MINLFNEIYTTYIDIAPYLFIGLLFAGLLHIIFKKDFVAKHLGKDNFGAVAKASILGVPLPLCSCGVIPTALYLRRQKASKGATLSFLISTPQTGVDSIIATYGMMGPVFAIFRPLAAFIMGIAGGFITNVITSNDSNNKTLEQKQSHPDDEPETQISTTLFGKFYIGLKYAFVEFLDDISLQLLVGVILAGIISFAIPDNFFESYGGNGIVGMLIMIVFGIPLYVCATASIPIAVSLILKGISPGAAFVFLVVGPATNAATITMIGNALGKKMVAIYLTVISTFAIMFGFLLNWIFDLLGSKSDLSAMHHEHGVAWYVYTATVLFSILLLMSLYRKLRPQKNKENSEEEQEFMSAMKKFKIEGMTCNHCVANVQNAIKSVEKVDTVKVDLAEKSAVVEGDFDEEKVKQAIKNSGYTVKE